MRILSQYYKRSELKKLRIHADDTIHDGYYDEIVIISVLVFIFINDFYLIYLLTMQFCDVKNLSNLVVLNSKCHQANNALNNAYFYFAFKSSVNMSFTRTSTRASYFEKIGDIFGDTGVGGRYLSGVDVLIR